MKVLNLDVTQKYILLDVSYLSIEDGGGCSCQNCGKLITNIATIKGENDGNVYSIGLDCLDNYIENNELLNNESHLQYVLSDKPAIQKAKSLRAKLLKEIKKYGDSFSIEFYSSDRCFGFSYSLKPNTEHNKSEYSKPLGFNYTFLPQYKDLTLNYIRDIFNPVLKFD